MRVCVCVRTYVGAALTKTACHLLTWARTTTLRNAGQIGCRVQRESRLVGPRDMEKSCSASLYAEESPSLLFLFPLRAALANFSSAQRARTKSLPNGNLSDLVKNGLSRDRDSGLPLLSCPPSSYRRSF